MAPSGPNLPAVQLTHGAALPALYCPPLGGGKSTQTQENTEREWLQVPKTTRVGDRCVSSRPPHPKRTTFVLSVCTSVREGQGSHEGLNPATPCPSTPPPLQPITRGGIPPPPHTHTQTYTKHGTLFLSIRRSLRERTQPKRTHTTNRANRTNWTQQLCMPTRATSHAYVPAHDAT